MRVMGLWRNARRAPAIVALPFVPPARFLAALTEKRETALQDVQRPRRERNLSEKRNDSVKDKDGNSSLKTRIFFTISCGVHDRSAAANLELLMITKLD